MIEYPVKAEAEGIKLQPHKMVQDRIYYCIFENKVFLFFKDNEDLLNCYEVDNEAVVQEILKDPSNIENILKSYSDAK